MIAQDVVEAQARVCEVRQDNFDEKLRAMAEATQANTKAIADLAKTVAVMASTIEPLPVTIKEREKEMDGLKERVNKLARRPAFWAAVGSALPVLAMVLWELVKK
jgi:uncharacterized protein Yka (UPF0111/DUF47 family)